MKYDIVLSITAVETFDSIREQIYNAWGEKIAADFEQRILNVLELIANSPFVYKAIPLNSNIRKSFIHRNCSMFYEIKEEIVEVLFFWDNRQDPAFL